MGGEGVCSSSSFYLKVMRKLFYIALMLFAISCAGGGNSDNSSEKAAATVVVGAERDVVEVLAFHTKKRCTSCATIEKLAREVVDSYGSDKIKLVIVDISANKEIAEKYKVAWTSLVVTYNGKSDNLTKNAFLYSKSSPDKFKSILKNSITNIKE